MNTAQWISTTMGFSTLVTAILTYVHWRRAIVIKALTDDLQRWMMERHRETYNKMEDRITMDTEKVLRLYYPMESKDRVTIPQLREQLPKANNMAHILFAIHKHAERCAEDNPDQVVYKKDDIVLLLERLGYTVQWGG
jgi:hypothetical protein